MKAVLIACLLLIPMWVFGQSVDDRLKEIEAALSEENTPLAAALFERYTRDYISDQDYLSLSYFIPRSGFIAHRRDNVDAGMESVRHWLEYIQSQTNDPRVLRQAHLESHTFYIFAGKYQMAYDANKTALDYTFKIPDYAPSEWALIESNLGVIANYLGKSDLARSHTLKAKKGLDEDPNTSPVNRFNVLNDLGASYWYTAQYDSAEYFWKEAMAFLEQMESNPTNRYYRRAMIEGNLAALYDIQGKLEESAKLVKSSIAHNRYFIDTALDDPKRNRAFASIFYSSMNLGLVYKSMGNYKQALQIHEYALREKEKHFPPGHPEIAESLISVAQAHKSLMNFPKAKDYLHRAKDAIISADGGYYMQLADIHYTLGLLHDREGNPAEAKKQYLKAQSFFEKANKGKMDEVYLGFLGQASVFFAKYGEADRALELSEKGYEYIRRMQGINSLSGFNQVINRSRVYFHLERFEAAKKMAEEGLDILEGRLKVAANSTDSVRVAYEKPFALLLQTKSAYRLQREKSANFLLSIWSQLREAQELLDQRKAMLSDSEDLAVLLSQHQELIDFMKQISLELFEETGDEAYLNRLLHTHESSIYSKIRTQLNQQRQVKFLGIPESVIAEEDRIKHELANVLSGRGTLEAFLNWSEKWEKFRKKLEAEYPAYYRTRYGEIGDDDWEIPGNPQVVRYLFVGDELKAVVLKNGEKHLFHLNLNPELIVKLPTLWHDAEALGSVTHQLYRQLWEPFSEILDESTVLVVPDGLLFNLSFDLLTDRPIKRYEAFATNSLLARHDISYQYCLWQLGISSDRTYPTNYAAFAPGFLDKMKTDYLAAVKDSLHLDLDYLSLLPQPFTVGLAESMASLFGGKSFLYEHSTTTAFKKMAGQNKVIHIATHAESNNISPAFSRLIFAKSGVPEEDNSVYAFELYNLDLRSNLTILTACETGRSTHKPGEGMISLAHAFRYAGSENLLISLWKVDEKSSMQITNYFLEGLAAGETKDRALKLAKLRYLSESSGRTLSPQYWAGMVLLGDPSPIPLPKTNVGYWWLGLLIVFALIYGGYKVVRSANIRYGRR